MFLVRRLRIWTTRSISLLPADDRVELALAGELGEIAAEGVEGRGFGFGFAGGAFAAAAAAAARFTGFHVVPQQVENFFADVFELEAEVHENLGSHAFLFAQKAEQEVLGADVVVIELPRLLDGVFDDFFGPRRLGQLPHGDHVGPGLDDFFDFQADFAQVNVEIFQDIGGNAGSLLDQAEQNMFGPDVFMVEALRLLVGELHHLAGPVGESFVHWPITLRHSWTISCWKIAGRYNPQTGRSRQLRSAVLFRTCASRELHQHSMMGK